MVTERDIRTRSRAMRVNNGRRLTVVTLKVRQRVRSAKVRKDSQRAEAIGRTQYVRKGYAKVGGSEFEKDGEEKKMRGIPPLEGVTGAAYLGEVVVKA